MLACFEDIDAAVHARALAVPEAEDAVEAFLCRGQVELLAPQTAVAPSSSLTPGWKTMLEAASASRGHQGLVGAERRAPGSR